MMLTSETPQREAVKARVDYMNSYLASNRSRYVTIEEIRKLEEGMWPRYLTATATGVINLRSSDNVAVKRHAIQEIMRDLQANPGHSDTAKRHDNMSKVIGDNLQTVKDDSLKRDLYSLIRLIITMKDGVPFEPVDSDETKRAFRLRASLATEPEWSIIEVFSLAHESLIRTDPSKYWVGNDNVHYAELAKIGLSQLLSASLPAESSPCGFTEVTFGAHQRLAEVTLRTMPGLVEVAVMDEVLPLLARFLASHDRTVLDFCLKALFKASHFQDSWEALKTMEIEIELTEGGRRNSRVKVTDILGMLERRNEPTVTTTARKILHEISRTSPRKQKALTDPEKVGQNGVIKVEGDDMGFTANFKSIPLNELFARTQNGRGFGFGGYNDGEEHEDLDEEEDA
ncbi:hypothetical protein BLNAU_989 [Blattamonas nauphoetae]|uniref:Uncharacterized protein n=1 Tax=Blattamonas nauphoetae TaxID=2049346 RepID=A0ABQ9YJJ6_9EUKA|nr:hypothetical protein BLNAU_989 [Blattamonas nauphoetae]